jgi:hypothetical protein
MFEEIFKEIGLKEDDTDGIDEGANKGEKEGNPAL